MGADQDAITVLKDLILGDKLAIDLHWVLVDIVRVGDHRCLSLIAIKVEAALPVGNTDTLNGDLWLELGALLANKVVTIVHGELDHARHLGVLIDVTKLGRSFQLFILAMPRFGFAALSSKFGLELGLFLSEGLLLLSLELHQLLARNVIAGRCCTTSNAAALARTATSKSLDLLSQLPNEFILR